MAPWGTLVGSHAITIITRNNEVFMNHQHNQMNPIKLM